jgi:hypothetical protein
VTAVEVRALAASEVERLERDELPTCVYAYVHDVGVTRQATQTDEALVRDRG